MKASYLLKRNVDAMLQARGQTRHDLAMWCRRTDAWLSKILGKDDRNIPMKYLDRIADFFGIATYQLFQPGIDPLTERRTGRDRRALQDRRISHLTAVLRPHAPPAPPADVITLDRLRRLTERDPAARELVERTIDAALRRQAPPAGASNPEATGADAAQAAGTTGKPRRTRTNRTNG